MASPNILISGGGIAGSVFAYWLLRACPTAKITIIERGPSLRLTGASVDIRSSAVDIIKWMGAEQEIRKHTTNEEGIQFVKSDGKAIGTLESTGRTDIQSITSEFEIFRGALAEIFMRPVMKRAQLVFNESVESFEQHDDGVIVTFASSKARRKYDLLVAADGMGSKIRGMMLKTNPREQVHDEGVTVAYFTIKNDLLQGSRLAKWYNTTGGRCIFLRPDPDPSGRTRGNLMNVTWSSDTERRKQFETALYEGNESYKALMYDQFHDAGWLATDVLKGMQESEDFYCSLFAQVRSPKLHDRRVVLLGDSGYATPGMGTSLAIMGGYILAGEILRSPDDMSTALKAYEDLMVPFVKSQQGDNSAMQLLNPQSQWGITLRNAILTVVTGIRLDKLVINAAAAFGFTEKKPHMPEYTWPPQQE